MTKRLENHPLDMVRKVCGAVATTVSMLFSDLKRPTIETNNRLAVFLLGFLPGAFGSLTTLCMGAWSVWAIVSLARRTYPPKLTPMSFRVAVCLTALPAALVAGMIGADKNFELVRKLPEALVFLCGWLLLVRFESRPRTGHFDTLTFGGALGCIAALLIAIVQFATGQRAEGGAGNANVFCLVVTIQTLFALFGLLNPRTEFRYLSVVGGLSGAMSVVLSGSRLGWVFFLIVITAAFISILKVKGFSYRTFIRGIYGVLMFFAFAVITNWYRLEAAVQDIRMILILGDYNSSIGERIIYWLSALRAFADAPIFGHGINNRMSAIMASAPEGYASFITATHPHNDYLAAAVDSGIFGFAGVAIALLGPYVIVRSGFRSAHPAVTLTGFVTLTFALFGLNGNMFGHDLSAAIFLLAITHLAAIISFQSDV